MKILSLNLAKRMDAAQEKLMREENFDACFFQEYVMENSWVMDFDFDFFETVALKSLFKDRHCGTAILLKEKYSAMATKRSFLSPDKEFLIRKNKSMTAVVCGPSEEFPKGLLLVSVHGHNGWPLRKPEPLKRQLEELTVLLAGTHQMPAVIAGDFNTFNVEREAVVYNFMRSNGVWTDWRPAYYDNKKTLDHIFTRGIKIKNFTTRKGLSDHPAMIFEI